MIFCVNVSQLYAFQHSSYKEVQHVLHKESVTGSALIMFRLLSYAVNPQN